MKDLRPLKDRLVCKRLPVKTPLLIVSNKGEQLDRTTLIRFEVLKVGPQVTEVVVGDIIGMGSKRFVAANNIHKLNSENVYLFHEVDVDVIILDKEGVE